MIDVDSWPLVLKLSFVVAPVVIALLGVAINIYSTVTRDYHVICSSITSSPYIEGLKVTWGASHLKWRFCLVCAIGGIVNFPGSALRRGQLDADELNAFPPKLKRRLALSLWLTLTGFSWMVLAATLIKLSKLE